MINQNKELLIKQYKQMRMVFFNIYNEDKQKFEKDYKDEPLYEIVVKHLDKSFTQVNQIANIEIENYLNNSK